MKLSWRWILEFLQTDLTPPQAADRLVNGGVEVGSFERLAPGVEGVVVGEVEAVERDLGEYRGHHLRLVRVSTGRERFSVLCGAPNCVAGVRAAFAPPRATLPGGRRIEVATIRGVRSQGMLCSEKDLGIGEEHEGGILLVGEEAPLGADLLAHLGLDDWVLEVEITPNRPDCLSIVGVGRELAALTGGKFQYPTIAVAEGEGAAHALARVRIDDPDLCPRYAARVIAGVRVGPSPAWMAARLRAVGLRPISNVVDVTNYVLWELGHPLHAFDYDTVADHTIVVRRARRGERLTTLDGQDRALGESMLVIADPERAIGIGGVMGGANTEVTGATTRVLLEAAYFKPDSIRRTSRDLGLKTDAAYRFERGADIEGLRDAIDRAAQLIAEVAGGVVARGVIDVYPAPRRRPVVRLRMSRIQRVIGASPPVEEVARILEGLGLLVRREPGALQVEVPAFRRDIAIEEDLVEEVIRVWGYDRIPSTLPGGTLIPARRPRTLEQAAAARRALVAAGLDEVITYAFEDPARAAALGLASSDDSLLRLLNPLSQDASALKSDLMPALLRVIATNVRRQQPNVRVFEIGKHYARVRGEPAESRWLALALTGARANPAWYAPREPADGFDAKGLAEHVLAVLGLRDVAVDADPGAHPYFEPGRWGRLVVGGTAVAAFGEIALPAREVFDIPAPVFGATIPLDVVVAIAVEPPRFVALPRHPSVQRDVAFVIPQSLPAAEVEQVIRSAGGALLRSVTLFDLYAGEGVGPGTRSLAWRLTFRADDRTLTDAEVNDAYARVIEDVRRRFGVEVRGT
ncbi:MAG: phenylalanine--tRNA ligase subunit beta [Candidatus Rokubacteria bacterium]|nr:phenylalanine--tRNA ligase subunit beta [Candidatus Rokubacteria bacterium]